MVAAAEAAGKRERKTVERMVQEPAPVIKKRPKAKKEKAKPVKASKKAEKSSKSAKPAKKEKDPNAPKRALSAFMFFSQDNREKIKTENEGCSFGEVGKYLGEAWGKADKATKAKYDKMAEKDKARYEKEKAKYNK